MCYTYVYNLGSWQTATHTQTHQTCTLSHTKCARCHTHYQTQSQIHKNTLSASRFSYLQKHHARASHCHKCAPFPHTHDPATNTQNQAATATLILCHIRIHSAQDTHPHRWDLLCTPIHFMHTHRKRNQKSILKHCPTQRHSLTQSHKMNPTHMMPQMYTAENTATHTHTHICCSHMPNTHPLPHELCDTH